MIQNRPVIAVIPARGGSKGLPRKNIKPLLEKPLIVWSIDAARKSRHIDALVVSTEDEEIAAVARTYGVEVPYLRPAALATDTAATIDVLRHVLEEEEKRGRRFAYLVLLEPTSPHSAMSYRNGSPTRWTTSTIFSWWKPCSRRNRSSRTCSRMKTVR